MARYWGSSGDNYLRYAGVSVSGYPLTMAAWVRPNNSAVNQTVMGVFGDNDAFYLALDLSAAGDPVRAVSWSTGTGFAFSERTGVTTGDWQHIGAEFAGSTSRTARRAGVAGTTNTTASTVTFGNLTRTTLGRFDRGTPTSQLVDCSQAYGAMWATTLTDAEWAALAAGLHPVCVRPSALLHVWDLDGNRDPEPDRLGLASLTVFGTLSADAYPRIFYPRGRSMVALGSGGGGVSLTADPGSYALTGSPATLLRHRVLTADPGSYAITGTDATLARGYVLVTDAGAYLLTGAAADLQHARRLVADPGSYALTGSAADLLYTSDTELVADPGVYSLTGAAASLLVHRTLLADPGSYALTGADAGLAQGYLLTGDPGSYAVTGADAAFGRDYVLSGDPGAYTLTGAAATLIRDGAAELTADPGVYALTGADAVMLVHRVLHAEPGSYSVLGANAGLVIPYRLRSSVVRRVRRAPHLTDEDVWLFYRMLQVDLEAGLGLASGQGSDPQVMLRWSDDDGETWSTEYSVSAGRQGEYQRRAVWRRLGRSRDRIFEVSVSDPSTWHLLSCYLRVDRGES